MAHQQYEYSKTKSNSTIQAVANKIGEKSKVIIDNRPVGPLQKKANKTGLPDKLKSGIENLSGIAMDNVKVHYNSDKPSQLNAHAYAQGTDIHIATGQEKHLPHEAWHVVQQAQGRVKPTIQMNSGFDINDDSGLEKEADVMGLRALNNVVQRKTNNKSAFSLTNTSLPVQRFIYINQEKKNADAARAAVDAAGVDPEIANAVKDMIAGWANLPDIIIKQKYQLEPEQLRTDSWAPVIALAVARVQKNTRGPEIPKVGTPLATTLLGHSSDDENIDQGTFIMYLPEELAQFELTVVNGLIYQKGRPVSAKGFLFVVHQDGRIFMAQEKRHIVQHSSLSGGKQPIAAGTITINQGLVQNINEKSGHYMPPKGTAQFVKELLGKKKANVKQTVAEEFKGELQVVPNRVGNAETEVLAVKAFALRKKQLSGLRNSMDSLPSSSPALPDLRQQLDQCERELQAISVELEHIKDSLQRLKIRLAQLGRNLDELQLRLDALK